MNWRTESVSAVTEWFEGIPSKSTRKNYRNGIKQFEAWYGSSVTKLIKDPEANRIVEKFFVHLKHFHPQNTCRNWTNSVMQFLKYNRVDVRPRRALEIYKIEKSTKHHRLTIDEVQ